MIGLPIIYWFGLDHFARHLTCMMAIGVRPPLSLFQLCSAAQFPIILFKLIVCSMFKDYLCLPRPTSPVVRLAETHNMEFGFPSSHSVNGNHRTL